MSSLFYLPWSAFLGGGGEGSYDAMLAMLARFQVGMVGGGTVAGSQGSYQRKKKSAKKKKKRQSVLLYSSMQALISVVQ